MATVGTRKDGNSPLCGSDKCKFSFMVDFRLRLGTIGFLHRLGLGHRAREKSGVVEGEGGSR